VDLRSWATTALEQLDSTELDLHSMVKCIKAELEHPFFTSPAKAVKTSLPWCNGSIQAVSSNESRLGL
jgi:hypothetical protein